RSLLGEAGSSAGGFDRWDIMNTFSLKLWLHEHNTFKTRRNKEQNFEMEKKQRLVAAREVSINEVSCIATDLHM
ncbi:hypothetical protein ACJX0J_022010, partial [Zea mays]